jgi:glycosyltransferase involved in cell wall biosynthesis
VTTPRYSVVVPAYNEERLLPRLLDSIDTARTAYAGIGNVEVIVADNSSTDRTASIAAARGARVVSVEKRVIAAARNGGARAARGEILAFTDADSQVHPRTFAEIDSALATGRVVGGATGVTLERWSAGIAVAYAIMLPMVLITGMDTGVVFCRRRDFDAMGGYDENILIAEDVAFLHALRQLGKTRGQRLARVTSAKGIASTRKFDEYGDWHFFTVLAAGIKYLWTRDMTAFVDRYWYKPRR